MYFLTYSMKGKSLEVCDDGSTIARNYKNKDSSRWCANTSTFVSFSFCFCADPFSSWKFNGWFISNVAISPQHNFIMEAIVHSIQILLSANPLLSGLATLKIDTVDCGTWSLYSSRTTFKPIVEVNRPCGSLLWKNQIISISKKAQVVIGSVYLIMNRHEWDGLSDHNLHGGTC